MPYFQWFSLSYPKPLALIFDIEIRLQIQTKTNRIRILFRDWTTGQTGSSKQQKEEDSWYESNLRDFAFSEFLIKINEIRRMVR